MLSKYILLFTLCSLVGWVWESLYAVIKTGKWEARGFLYGPMCPIYGFGVCGIVLLAKVYLTYAHNTYLWWQILLAGFFGSMLLEYVTSWVFEQLFHAYWWDYSDMPLNINGRTCIPAGILFALGGLAAVELISPWWDAVMAPVPKLAMDIMGYAVVFIIAMDVTLTVSSMTAIQEQVALAAATFHTKADAVTDNITGTVSGAAGTVADTVTGAAGTVAGAASNAAGTVAGAASNAAGTVAGAAATAASRISAEKDRIKEETLQNAFDNLSASTRFTLQRVQGFRLPSPNINMPNASDFPSMAKGLLDRAKSWRS